MASIPAGGPSTINGVLYQMLWALHRLGALTAFSPEVDDATGQLTDVTIVLNRPTEGTTRKSKAIGGLLSKSNRVQACALGPYKRLFGKYCPIFIGQSIWRTRILYIAL